MRFALISVTALLICAACTKGEMEDAFLKVGISLAKGTCQESRNCSVQCGKGEYLRKRDLKCRDNPG
ncbi:MAG: hypothetical protein NXI13_07005 [Proteobacteria bacterium]|nr:hypothetical protein [Pseudomonadota bacterium]